MVRFEPDPTEGELSAGFEIERGTRIRSLLGRGEQTACEYRTAHPVTLWPLEIAAATYAKGGLTKIEAPPEFEGTRATLRLTLRCTAGLTFDQLALSALPIYIRGEGELPNHLYEQILGQSLGVLAGPAGPNPAVARVDPATVDPAGRVRRRPRAPALRAALVPGVPAASGVLQLSAAVSLRRARRPRAGGPPL